MWFIKNGSFSKIEESIIFDRIKKEYNQSNLLSLNDFLFNCLGFRNDVNMSPFSRFKERKTIMENIENPKFWVDKSKEMGTKRTSEVVDILKYLEVQGLGKDDISIQSSKFYIANFQDFVQNNKELIEVFCSGHILLNTRYLNGDSEAVSVKEIIEMLVSSSAKEFERKCKSAKLDFSKLLNVKSSSKIKINGNTLFIPEHVIDKYGISQTIKFLIFSVTINADKLPIASIDSFMKYLPKFLDLFTIGDEDFLRLLDLGFMSKKTVEELLQLVGIKIPDLDEMIKLTRGIYLLSNNSVHYIPKHLDLERAMCCKFTAINFCEYVGREILTEIIYRDSMPFLGGVSVK